ncbi:MAG: NUDIX domain-containing protein [Thermotogaceae bacterium]|nr:NUDIX domain-containing protein [Thermotogaceae bacterium]
MPEIWNIYTKNRELTLKKHVRGIPLQEGDYHLVVEVWILRSSGRLLVTKRHPDKPFPNMWECTGGSAIEEEDSASAAIREVEEEIGVHLEASDGKMIHQYTSEDSHYDVWLFRKDIPLEDLVFQEREVIDAKYVTPQELRILLERGEMIPKLCYILSLIETGVVSAGMLT